MLLIYIIYNRITNYIINLRGLGGLGAQADAAGSGPYTYIYIYIYLYK